MLGDIYAGAQLRFTKPISLNTLIKRIDETEWNALGVDVKDNGCESPFEKAACEGRKGAGQMFTPRVLIQTFVWCVNPGTRSHRNAAIRDPACQPIARPANRTVSVPTGASDNACRGSGDYFCRLSVSPPQDGAVERLT